MLAASHRYHYVLFQEDGEVTLSAKSTFCCPIALALCS
jgi:hypothetical protein